MGTQAIWNFLSRVPVFVKQKRCCENASSNVVCLTPFSCLRLFLLSLRKQRDITRVRDDANCDVLGPIRNEQADKKILEEVGDTNDNRTRLVQSWC